MAYNRILVDKAIGNLEQSLSQVAYAQTADDMKMLKFFLDELLVTELAEKNLDAKRFSSLEFSKGIVFEAKDFRQIRDVKFVLEDVLADRAKKRKPWLKFMDQSLVVIKGWFGLGGKLSAPAVNVRKGRELTDEERDLYQQAKSFDDNWEITKALNIYEKLLEKASDYKNITDIQFDVCYAHLKLGRYERARAMLLRIQNENKGMKEDAVAKILTKKSFELQDMAKERDRLLAEVGSAKSAYELQQIYFKVGFLHYKLFDLRKAEESFRNASTIIQENQAAMKSLFYLGLTLKFHAKFKEASEIFKDLTDRFPKSEFAVYSRYQLADSFQKAGEFEKAAQEFETIAFNFPQTPIATLSQFRAGYTYFYDVGDPIRAAGAFDKLKTHFTDDRFASYSKVEISPFIRSTIRDYGFTLLKRGFNLEARNAFEEAIRADSKDAWAYSGLATVHAFLGNQKEALENARQGMKVSADEYTVAAMGFVSELTGDYEKGMDHYKKALQIKKKYPSVIYNLARLYELTGNYDKAIETYKEVITHSAGWADPHNNLGHAYWYKGQTQEAIEYFKKAVELDPKSIESRYNLAVAYQTQNQNDLAKKEYEQILTLDPSFRQAQTALDSLVKRDK